MVQRSAAARAEVNGTSVDDVLSAWAGGAPAAAPEPAPRPAPERESVEPAAAAEPKEPAAPVTVMEPPAVPEPAPVVEEAPVEPEEPLEPVPLMTRVRTAVRIGAWVGAALGVVAFLVASAFWSSRAAVIPDTGPVVQVDSTAVLVGTILVSIVFGAIVATLSRAGASWTDPAMQLSSSRTTTGWIGAAIGLVLGVAAGAILTGGFGTEVEGGEGLIQLPVLATLIVMLIGGGILGSLTAALPQLFGTPVAVEDQEEVATVRSRLGNAVGVPVAGAVILIVLVLPFAYILIQSNHMAENGAALVAVLVAGGILGFAALAGTKPEMKISLGDLMVAVIGIGTVLVIILAVLIFNAPEEEHDSGSEGEEATAVVLVL